jgi:hypothetical protein
LETAQWKPSPRTDADEQSEFLYQPEGWEKPTPVQISFLTKKAISL